MEFYYFIHKFQFFLIINPFSVLNLHKKNNHHRLLWLLFQSITCFCFLLIFHFNFKLYLLPLNLILKYCFIQIINFILIIFLNFNSKKNFTLNFFLNLTLNPYFILIKYFIQINFLILFEIIMIFLTIINKKLKYIQIITIFLKMKSINNKSNNNSNKNNNRKKKESKL